VIIFNKGVFGAFTWWFKSSSIKFTSSTRMESSSVDHVWIESTWSQSSTRRPRFV